MRAHRVAALFSLLFVYSACTREQSAARFPEHEVVGGLPAGFSWAFRNGPDFYTYVASNPAQPECTVGVYFGNAPSFKPSATARGEIGAFAERAVNWEAPSQADRLLRRDALLPYRHNRASRELVLHIWVQAPTPETLAGLLSALRSARLQERSTNGPA